MEPGSDGAFIAPPTQSHTMLVENLTKTIPPNDGKLSYRDSIARASETIIENAKFVAAFSDGGGYHQDQLTMERKIYRH
ncbi:hypothetical protein SUGI_0727250 [Cryptomeria japonica]|nr:hypothetical protein SUGI_0727250 [Cryptomeria japonica]